MRLVSRILLVLAKVTLGILALAALAVCALVWRLGEGPVDITPFLRREHARLQPPGASLSVGHATLALGKAGTGRQLDLEVRDVAAAKADGSASAKVGRIGVSLSVPQLLLGRLAPRSITLDDADVELHATTAVTLRRGLTGTASGEAPPWLQQLQRVRVHGLLMTIHGLQPGLDGLATRAEADLHRLPGGGLAGAATLQLQAGATQAILDVQAAEHDGTTQVTATSSPVSPAALAGLAPELAGLAALDVPLRLALQASVKANLALGSARLDVTGSPGTLHAGRGSVALTSLAATLTATPAGLRLEAFRAALAPAGPHGPPPVITGTASATRAAGRIHAVFGVAVDNVAFADLPRYWPEGTGGGARSWLVQNVTAGHAHDGQVAGSLDAPADLSDATLTTLSGGMLADDVSLTWLRPIPGLTHARARVVLEGPDSLTVTMDRGGQNNLVLAPGSSIRITGLQDRDQFGDIAVGLSGALPDALGLLNHPRLHLLDRSGIQVVGAAGMVTARITIRVPLVDRVTMDQIAIGANATLSGVHLGRIAAGRDLDDGNLRLKVTGDGLQAAGTGAVSGIPARLSLNMDFRNGGPDQVLQHVTAVGTASVAQLRRAGLPGAALKVITAGQAGLSVDYAGLRSGTALLQIDTNLGQAALKTPLGWSKAAGQPATLGGQVTLDHGRLAAVDHLHADGPGLAIVSHTQIVGPARALLLDRLEIGGTRATGRIGFPATPGAPVSLALSGPALDLSSALDAPSPPAPATPPSEPAPEARGQAWAATLAFGAVTLSRGKTLAPFDLDAADDGLRILHAHVRAGSQGELAVDVTPEPGGRSLALSAADAGAALHALGVADNLAGGKLVLDGRYDDTKPGAPLAGTATLTGFNLRNAPAIGRLLQEMTLYGVADVLHGPGLHFSKMVAPFSWHDGVLDLANARAFSNSLGITAQGELDLRHRTADITGTVVPAYFFNQLLGDLPLVGRVFSPEKGGGVFAARYSVHGPFAAPKVGVNPLSALTPGFLREGFGLFTPRQAK